MLGQEDAGIHGTSAGRIQPLGCLTCDRPGDPHTKGLCSCSTIFRRRLPVGTGVLGGPIAFSPTASLRDVCSPDSGEASPASGRLLSPAASSLPDPPDSPEAAAAASAMPGPGDLQNLLMFGAATPRAASAATPLAASQPAPPASSQGGPAQGACLHTLTRALNSPPLRTAGKWSGFLRREQVVREEDIQHEVEALRIDMGLQDMPRTDGAEGNVLEPADLVADTALLRRQKDSDTWKPTDFDDVLASSAHQPEDCPIGAGGAASSTADPGSRGGISEQQRYQEHLQALQSSYGGFRCRCPLASSANASSCLDEFSRQDLTAIFYQVYPRSGDGITVPHVAVSDVRTALHQLMWNMKRPAPRRGQPASEDQRVFCIPRWTLEKRDGKSVEVCRESWKRAVGGSDFAHRSLYSMVLRGHSPAAAACEKGGSTIVHKLLTGLSTAEIGLQARKHSFAVQWWLDLLKVMCFMPNERKVLIRGPSYAFYHGKVYAPVAMKVGLYLKRTAWSQCLPDALTALAATLPGDGDNPKPLRAGRCAKHSRFPECSTCVSTREEYLAASRNPGTPPEVGETLMSSSP